MARNRGGVIDEYNDYFGVNRGAPCREVSCYAETSPMKKILINGRQFAYEVIGARSPTVVLETGIGAESSEWAPIASTTARSNAVFRYDRAGRGESELGQGNRDALIMVDELNALLAATQTKGPYLLVGHSFGGLLMRLFASANRASVCGLVLVESIHRGQFEVMGPAFPDPSSSDVPALVQVRTFWTGGWRDPNSTVEHIDFERSFVQDQAVTTLGNLPLFYHLRCVGPEHALCPRRVSQAKTSTPVGQATGRSLPSFR